MSRRILLHAGVLVCSVTVMLAQQQPPAFRSRITMVPVDVRVVDKNGKPITDLKQSDFTIAEDGVPQAIKHFSTQALIAEKVATSTPVRPAFRNAATPEIAPQTNRVFLVVLGRAGLGGANGPSKEIPALINFVRTRLLPQDQVSILAYNRATDFTTDHAQLVQVLERFKAKQAGIENMLWLHFSGLQAAYGSKTIPANIQAEIDGLFAGVSALRPREIRPGQITDHEQISRDVRSTADDVRIAEAGRARAAAAAAAGVPDTSIHDTFAEANADALDLTFDEYVSRQSEVLQDLGNMYAGIDYLRYITGEKHLVFVTGKGLSLPRIENDRSLAMAASDARIALDIVFTGGVVGVPPPIMQGPNRPFMNQTRGLPNLPTNAAVFGQTFNIQALRYVGELTGGQVTAFRLAEDFFRHLDDATRFQYLLGYYPTNTNWNGGVRKIAVKVNRPGATVLYRRGYYASEQLVPLDRREFLTYSRITAAGTYEGEITDIGVTVKPPTIEGPPGAREIAIDLNIVSNKIGFTVVDGRHVGALDVGIYCGNQKKQVVCDGLQRMDLKLSDESYQKFQNGGAGYTARLPLTGEPEYVKVIVYDYATDLLGSAVVRMKR